MVGVANDETVAFLSAADASIHAVLNLIPRSVYNPSEPATVAAALDSKRTKAQQKNTRKQLAASAAARTAKAVAAKPAHAPGSNAAKLEQKVSALRAARKADDPGIVAKQTWRKQQRDEAAALAETAEGKKMKKAKAKENKKNEKVSKKRAAPDSVGIDGEGASKDSRKKSKTGMKVKTVDNEADDADIEKVTGAQLGDTLEISSVKGFAGEDGKEDKSKRKKRKETRLEHLQKTLENAEAEQETKAELANDGGADASAVLLDREMEKALLRAQGVSVKDKASKLRKTIRKETRKKEKSREDWAARIENVKEEKEKKQDRREERLKARREGKGVRKGGDGSGKKKKSTTAHKKRH
jgi:Surfeit locus protein 6